MPTSKASSVPVRPFRKSTGALESFGEHRPQHAQDHLAGSCEVPAGQSPAQIGQALAAALAGEVAGRNERPEHPVETVSLCLRQFA